MKAGDIVKSRLTGRYGEVIYAPTYREAAITSIGVRWEGTSSSVYRLRSKCKVVTDERELARYQARQALGLAP